MGRCWTFCPEGPFWADLKSKRILSFSFFVMSVVCCVLSVQKNKKV